MDVHELPRVTLSLPPSAFALPEGWDITEDFGEKWAGMVAAAILTLSQAADGDEWRGLPVAFLHTGINAMAAAAGRGGDGILALMEDFRPISVAMHTAGLGELISEGDGDSAYIALLPTELLLERLSRYRVPA